MSHLIAKLPAENESLRLSLTGYDDMYQVWVGEVFLGAFDVNDWAKGFEAMGGDAAKDGAPTLCYVYLDDDASDDNDECSECLTPEWLDDDEVWRLHEFGFGEWHLTEDDVGFWADAFAAAQAILGRCHGSEEVKEARERAERAKRELERVRQDMMAQVVRDEAYHLLVEGVL